MRIFWLLVAPLLTFAGTPQFAPPAGWNMVQPKISSPHLKVGFLGKGSTDFRPIITLSAEEQVDVSLKEYLKAVKELQKADPRIREWRDLGKFPMKGGMGHLIEMTSNSPWGEQQIFQVFLLRDTTVYFLTASLLKEDLGQLQSALFESFRSLTVTPKQSEVP